MRNLYEERLDLTELDYIYFSNEQMAVRSMLITIGMTSKGNSNMYEFAISASCSLQFYFFELTFEGVLQMLRRIMFTEKHDKTLNKIVRNFIKTVEQSHEYWFRFNHEGIQRKDLL
jgi:hypothetical protein